MAIIESTLVELVDEKGCHLVLTTGGHRPARPTSRQSHARIATR